MLVVSDQRAGRDGKETVGTKFGGTKRRIRRIGTTKRRVLDAGTAAVAGRARGFLSVHRRRVAHKIFFDGGNFHHLFLSLKNELFKSQKQRLGNDENIVGRKKRVAIVRSKSR